MVLDLVDLVMKAIFYALYKKSAFILDADISGCFDNIKHHALLEKLNTTPTLKRTIKKWLRAGVMENGTFQPTKSGTIQGGTITPPTTLQIFLFFSIMSRRVW
ncbi:reverse transcriptase domain-containing protein [Wolbachia endosymbiont (group A) of Pogonocherus hispidulus]|uniref:reverse transcriptase domain-containing protein n=1 Tax=Wolbachia endosymbiont (group A) of Pogonocherus hispidulus TaxID=3066136 RepID=UPI003341C3D2